MRRHRADTLEPQWKGPYIILLTTLMAVKVDGISNWIHAPHLKLAPTTAAPEEEWQLEKTDNLLKLRIHRISLSNPER